MDLQEDTTFRPKRSLMTLSSCRRLQIAVFILVVISYFRFIAHVLVNTVINTEYMGNDVTERSHSSDITKNVNSQEIMTALSVLNVSKHIQERRPEVSADHVLRYNKSCDPIDKETMYSKSKLNVSELHNESIYKIIHQPFTSCRTNSNNMVVDKTINVVSTLNIYRLNNSEIKKEHLPEINEDIFNNINEISNKPMAKETIIVIHEILFSNPDENHLKENFSDNYHIDINVSNLFVLSLFCKGRMCLQKCCSIGPDYNINSKWDCAFNTINDASFEIVVKWTQTIWTFTGSFYENDCELYLRTNYYESQFRLSKGSIFIKREWFNTFCPGMEVIDNFLLVNECDKNNDIEGVFYDGIYEERDEYGNLKINVSMLNNIYYISAGYVTDNLEDYKNTNTTLSYLYITGFVLMSISTISMITIIIVYTCTPKLLNVNGKIIIQYLISVVIHNLTLFWGKMYEIVNNYSVADVVNRSSQFSWITWMTIMCFDIWYVFSQPLASQPHLSHGKEKFKWYCIVAWGNVLLHLFLYTTFDDLSVYDRENLEKLFTTLGVILNTLLFLSTLLNMWFHNAYNSVVTPQRDFLTSSLRMYTKLFLLMGLDWLFALVCFENGGEIISLVGVLIVQLQGIVLFILLVCNRRVLRILSQKYKKQSQRSI